MENQSQHFEDPFEKADKDEAKKKGPAAGRAVLEDGPAIVLEGEEERKWASWIHFSAFAMFLVPLGSILGPLVIWQMKREEMPVLDQAGKEAVNFNISMIIAYIIAGLLCVILVGIPIIIGLVIYHPIAIVLAGLASSRGEEYSYPKSIKFIK